MAPRRLKPLWAGLCLLGLSHCACPEPDCEPADCAGTCPDAARCPGDGDGDGDDPEPDPEPDGTLGAPCEGNADCDSGSCFGAVCTECDGASDCAEGETCLDGACVLDDECADDACGGGGQCCPSGAECTGGVCLSACDTVRCGPDLAACCAGDEVCYGGGCVLADQPCLSAADCDAGEVCELDLGVCLPEELVGTCEYVPPPGVFNPQIECRWTPNPGDIDANRNDVVMAPVVGNLSDDNDDGLTDRFDVPEVVFITYDFEDDGCCNQPGTLRIVAGACNPDGTMNTLASISDPAFDNSGGLALGDLNGDGVMEIVGIGMVGGNPQGTVALTRTAADGSAWEVLWTNDTYPTWDIHQRGGAQPALADLEGDGTVEVVIGNVVLEGLDGALRFDGVVTGLGAGGIGNNAFLGPVSVVGDLDRDGIQEVIAGNTAYAADDGEVIWTFPYTTQGSGCGGNLPCDGYPSVANFDDDADGEVAIVRQGEVFILDSDGAELHRIPIPIDDCANNESGPPTVADFDGDGRPEVGTAAGDYYVVIDPDCVDPLPAECASLGVLWTVPNEDCSSRVTASSVFDFEGDGAAEVIYADEDTFRILRGSDGFELFVDDTHGSHTRLEMAVIADVDNDGNAEVVIAENASRNGIPGVEIWGDALDNWVFTRRIWNQHSYHVTNISEEGEVLGGGFRNWDQPALNNFRQNVQGDGVFWAPDLLLESAAAFCTPDGNTLVRVTVRNDGSRMVGPGLSVALYTGPNEDDVDDPLGTLLTTRRLFPGDAEQLEANFDTAALVPLFSLRLVADDDGTGQGAHNECDEDNNAALLSVTCVGGGG